MARFVYSPLFFTSALVLSAYPAIQATANDTKVDEIVVTATKLPRGVQDIAGTISVIQADDIEQQQANDLNELVNYLPGVSMNSAARGGNQGFIIRGIGGNRVLTVLDGVRANDIYGAGPSSYGRDMFEVDDLQSVEIIRGPASVLYGADAIGGAVLLKSKDPSQLISNEGGGYFKLRGSSNSANAQTKLGFTSAWAANNLEGLVQYTQREFSEREVNGGAEINPFDGDNKNLLLKTNWQSLDNHRLTFTFDVLDEKITSDLNLEENGSSVLFSHGQDESQRQRVSVNHLWTVNSEFADTLESQIYFQKNDALQHTEQVRANSNNFNPAEDARRITDFEFNQQHLGADINAVSTFSLGSTTNASVYGIHFDTTDTERPRNRCETGIDSGNVTCDIAGRLGVESFPNKTFPDTKTQRTGLFWQNEMVFGETGFTVIPGIRYDNYQMTPSTDGLLDVTAFGFDVAAFDESEVSASLGAIYDVNESLALFAQYAEGFRPPNYDEANQAFVNQAHGYAVVPNPQLEAEVSQSYELGIKAQWTNADFELSLFSNQYENFIESQYIGNNGPIRLFQDANIGEAHIRGIEISSRAYIAENWRITAGLAFSKGDDEINNVPLDSIEPLSAVLSAGYFSSNDHWGLESFVRWADKKDRISDPNDVTADAYSVVDVSGFFNVNEKLSIRAGVFNLFDKEYAPWSNIAGLAADSEAVARANEPGTNFRLNLNYQF